MKCTRCEAEWEGEGLCPNCISASENAEISAADDAEKTTLIPAEDAVAEETAAQDETATATVAATDEASDSERAPGEEWKADGDLPRPLPAFSEGFEAGTETALPVKRKMGRAAVSCLSVFLTLLFFAAAFFVGSYFVKDVDLLHLFHADENPAKAEAAAIDCFETMYIDLSFSDYIETHFPPVARESYIENMVSAGGYASKEEMISAVDESQKTTYEGFTFSDLSAQTVFFYETDYLSTYLTENTSHLLYGTDCDPKSVDAVAEVEVAFRYTTADVTEPVEGSVPFVLALMDGTWYQIA